jgi:hypothetical protein
VADLTGEELDWREAKRAELLERFRQELGTGDPDRYWALVGPEHKGDHWCGALFLYICRECGLAPGVLWSFDPAKRRYGFAWRLDQVSPNQAQPGDLAYFAKHQHHAMVVRIEQGQGVPMLVTLDGNQGAPHRVREKRQRLSSVAAVYSIEPWLRAALDTIPAPAPGDDHGT